ncbi:MAG: response regulator [Cyclonatronaceae bacterium]
MEKNTKAPFPATILVVDDNARNLQLISSVLGKAGYKINAVNSGEKALSYLQKRQPDIILLDIMMPGMNGFEVCTELKASETLCDIPVIFLTAKSDGNDLVEGFQVGAVDYITKPFNSEEVLVRLANHLKLRKARYELEEKNTALVKAQEASEADARRLKALNAEKDRFFSILAHDLRGPFSGYMGLTEVLANHAAELSQEEVLEYSGALHQAASNVYKLLLNLLEWSRLQMGSLEFSPKPLRIKEQLRETLSMAARLAADKGISFSYEIPEMLSAKVDGYMLESIMRNLLTNAVKFTHPHGSIVIKAGSVAEDKTSDEAGELGEVYLEVSDTGIGIPPEMQEKLYRIDENISRPGTQGEESTGLGLLLCRDMIVKNGGRLHLESEENKGSRFRFTMPAALPVRQTADAP